MNKTAAENIIRAYLAANQPIKAVTMHQPSMQVLIDQIYNAQEAADLIGTIVGNAVSLQAGDKFIIFRAGTALKIDKSLVFSILDHARGDWAGTTAFPATGGTFTAGVPGRGDRWTLTDTLIIGGNVYGPGTVIEAAVNAPGQTLANWLKYSMQL